MTKDIKNEEAKKRFDEAISHLNYKSCICCNRAKREFDIELTMTREGVKCEGCNADIISPQCIYCEPRAN